MRDGQPWLCEIGGLEEMRRDEVADGELELLMEKERRRKT